MQRGPARGCVGGGRHGLPASVRLPALRRPRQPPRPCRLQDLAGDLWAGTEADRQCLDQHLRRGQGLLQAAAHKGPIEAANSARGAKPLVAEGQCGGPRPWKGAGQDCGAAHSALLAGKCVEENHLRAHCRGAAEGGGCGAGRGAAAQVLREWSGHAPVQGSAVAADDPGPQHPRRQHPRQPPRLPLHAPAAPPPLHQRARRRNGHCPRRQAHGRGGFSPTAGGSQRRRLVHWRPRHLSFWQRWQQRWWWQRRRRPGFSATGRGRQPGRAGTVGGGGRSGCRTGWEILDAGRGDGCGAE
mmetsp:Transcript_20354/g.61328  ORF Transcript_20354/g.61328 Transcript_20354/m.61328 type:complete len:299 (+) Transcript_20354:989-1885(+)